MALLEVILCAEEASAALRFLETDPEREHPAIGSAARRSGRVDTRAGIHPLFRQGHDSNGSVWNELGRVDRI